MKKTTFSDTDQISEQYDDDFDYTMKSESQHGESSESKKASLSKSAQLSDKMAGGRQH